MTASDPTITGFYQLTPEAVDIVIFSIIMGMDACSALLFFKGTPRARYWANVGFMVLMILFACIQAATGMHASMVASGIGAIIAALAALKAEFERDGRA